MIIKQQYVCVDNSQAIFKYLMNAKENQRNNGAMEMWSNFNEDDSAVAFVYFAREVSWTFKQYDKQVMVVIVFSSSLP